VEPALPQRARTVLDSRYRCFHLNLFIMGFKKLFKRVPSTTRTFRTHSAERVCMRCLLALRLQAVQPALLTVNDGTTNVILGA
jgi:hypothetical protein